MSAVRRCVSVLLIVLSPACAGFALPVGGDSVQVGGTNFSTGDDYLPELFSALVTYEVFHYPGGKVGGEYLYTYEISSDDVSTVGLSYFSVGIGDGGDAASPGFETNFDDVTPSGQYLVGSPPQSVDFLFIQDTIDGGESSALLYFVSDRGPGWGYGTLSGGGISKTGLLPTPVPEPCTLVLLGAAAMLGLGGTRRQAN